MSARCACGANATNQAVYLKDDGTYFLGNPVCDEHRYNLGRPPNAKGVEIVEYMAVRV